jgi:hypothetical protein
MHTAIVEQTSTAGSTPVENEAQALHRLAWQAKAQRVKIIVNVETNAHFAASVSRPGTLHKVTLYSCDCPGFLKHARCMHYAAVLEMYHSLPPIEGPDTSGPDSGPDGGGAALPVPTDVVVSVVPAPRGSPLRPASRTRTSPTPARARTAPPTSSGTPTRSSSTASPTGSATPSW